MLSDRIGPDVKTQWILTLSQCTFWCSVLSDTSGPVANNTQTKWSQYTFWCSVLSDKKTKAFSRHIGRVSMHLLVLSAFRHDVDDVDGVARRVSMHLLVLSAFRPERELEGSALHVSMHLMVFSAFRHNKLQPDVVLWIESQCTFWCSVLSDHLCDQPQRGLRPQSQCTFWCSVLSDERAINSGPRPGNRLNAPSGAQCFPTEDGGGSITVGNRVSMHLLVLSAFRRQGLGSASGMAGMVSMHLLVLSAFRPNDSNQPKGDDVSQCTFWCSVLSDQVQTAASNASALGLNAPSGAQCFPTTGSTILW